jgi:hypothetical protein
VRGLQGRLHENYRFMDGAAWSAAVDHVRSLAEEWHALEFASPVQAELVKSVRAGGDAANLPYPTRQQALTDVSRSMLRDMEVTEVSRAR